MASRQEVVGLYQDVLGRSPYESESAQGGWVDRWTRSGLSADQLRSKFMASNEYKSKQGGYGGGAGYGADSGNQQMQEFANQQKQAYADMLARQKAEEEGLFSQYEDTIGGQESLTELYKRFREEQGLPGLEDQIGSYKDEIYSVKSLLDSLEEDINTRTKGKFVNESQRNRQLAFEQTPLQNTLGRLGTGLEPLVEQQTAGLQQVSTLLGLTKEDQDKALRPMEMRINAISDRFAREITGFNSNKETQLSTLLDGIQRGRELSDRDWQLAQTLAAEEREFSRQKDLIAIKARSDASGGGDIANQILEAMGGGSTPAASEGSSGGYNNEFINTLSQNVDYGGGGVSFKDPSSGSSYTREQVRDVLKEMGMDDKGANDWVYGFKSYGERGVNGYTSPTSLFGM